MGPFLIALNSVLPLFLVIMAGTLFSRSKVASHQWIDILNKYALWIGLPALVVNGMLKLEGIDRAVVEVMVYNSLFIVSCILLAYPVKTIFAFSNQRRQALFFVFAYGNVAYLGIPVLQNLIGEDILPIASVLAALYVFWLLTLALVLVEVHGNAQFNAGQLFMRLIKSPLLISVVAGIVLVAFKIRLPLVAEKTISLFAGSVTAVVLFSLGIFIGYQKRATLKEWGESALFAVFIMLVLPAAYWLFLQKSGLPGDYMHASILDATMPLGLTSYALAHQYNLDTPFVARLVVVSTLLAIFNIPLWVVILNI